MGHVNTAAVQRRSREIWSRSLKSDTQQELLRRAVGVVDLTTLEGADTVGRVHRLCARAVRPDQDVQNVAAVCVYADMASAARAALDAMDIEKRVRIACVAGEFPSGRNTPQEKARAAKWAKEQGADEIDMVIDRGAMLSGNYKKVSEEVRAVCEASGGGEHVKVILECAELSSLSVIQHASEIAIEAGAGWIKTSTGKIQPAATLPVTLVMFEAIKDFYFKEGKMIGMKPAGGIATSKIAMQYLVVLRETLGEAWMNADWFRFGASSLANDVLMQLEKLETGVYQGPEYFSKD